MKKAFVFPVVALLLLSGCVSQKTFDTKAQESEMNASRASDLEAQTKKLNAELDALKKEKAALQEEKTAVEQEKENVQKDLQSKVKVLSVKAEKAEQLEKATQTYQNLQKKLEKEIQDGQVQLKEMKDRLTMTMVDKIIFPSGSTTISKEGKLVLDKVVSILKDVKDKRIQVEGHTDNVKITSELKQRFPTNWELSTARATEVVRYLQEHGSIDPSILAATGYGENQPVAPNDTDEGKHKNRRIEIVLLPLLK